MFHLSRWHFGNTNVNPLPQSLGTLRKRPLPLSHRCFCKRVLRSGKHVVMVHPRSFPRFRSSTEERYSIRENKLLIGTLRFTDEGKLWRPYLLVCVIDKMQVHFKPLFSKSYPILSPRNIFAVTLLYLQLSLSKHFSFAYLYLITGNLLKGIMKM